jgi:hypothetical protein
MDFSPVRGNKGNFASGTSVDRSKVHEKSKKETGTGFFLVGMENPAHCNGFKK